MESNENKVEDTSDAVIGVVEKVPRTRRNRSDAKSDVAGVGMDKTILGFLAFSVLINLFLFMHVNSLTGQVSTLTDIISNSNSGSRVITSVPTTVVNNAQPTVTTIVSSGKVVLAVVSDTRCKNCATDGLISSLTELFGPSLDYKVYDYSDAEGKRLLQVSGVKYLPAALFDDTVKSSSGYTQVSRYLSPAGSYLSLAVGADFDPSCYSSDGLPDCVKCSAMTECRELKPKQLDLFVMSQCPYGIQAINSMKDVLKTLKDIKFDIHYIADEANGVFTSLHGQGEVDENIRQLCAKKYYPTTFMDYIWCRSANIQADWKSCIGSMDLSKIEICSTGAEGKTLLSNDIKLATELKISASPTFVANNRVSFNAISPADIQTGICNQNSGMSGCSATLNSTTATPAGSC